MEKTKEIVSSMTIHGFPTISSSRSLKQKLFWSVVCLSTLAGFVAVITSRLQQFFEHKVYTSVENKVEKRMAFPAVTICNTNLHFLYEKNYKQSSLKGKKCSDKIKGRDFEHACKLFLSGVDNVIFFGHRSQPEFPNNFSQPRTYFPCFTINKNAVFHQQTLLGGLQMVLYFNKSDIIDYERELQLYEDGRFGLTLVIHDQSVELVFPYSDFFLESGTKIDITLRKIEYQRKPSPFPSKCVSSDPAVERIFGKYSLDNCNGVCYIDQVLATCNDIPPLTRYLTPWLTFNHSTVKSRLCAESFFPERFDQLKCVCPPPCQETVYMKTIQSIKWPNDNHFKALKKSIMKSPLNESFQNMSDDDFKQSFLLLNIRFADKSKQIVKEEELYPLGSLLSELGGLMGLFLGASLISLIEVGWVFVSFVGNFYQPRRHIQDREEEQ